MKYCLNYSVKKEYLQQADEIKLPYSKFELIFSKFLDYKCTFVLIMPNNNSTINWDKLKQAKILLKDNLILCCNNYKIADEAKERGFKFYMNYEVTNFYEFNSLLQAGVSYIRIGAPLIFQKDLMVSYKNYIRAVPNLAYEGIPRENSYCGKWIRPENQDLYEDFISILEFFENKTSTEEALFRIYKIEKKWSGNIKDIIHNFNHEGLNRLVLDDYIKSRLNCGQKCQIGKNCNICKRIIDLAQETVYKSWLEQDNNNLSSFNI